MDITEVVNKIDLELLKMQASTLAMLIDIRVLSEGVTEHLVGLLELADNVIIALDPPPVSFKK